MSDNVVYGRSELYYHADTTVAGANCCILQYTGKQWDVSPQRNNFEAIKGVSIVHSATGSKSPETGKTCILVLHEALWMGDTLDHNLVNPNQLRHYGNQVQDNLMPEILLYIITEYGEFSMKLSMEGGIVFASTHTPPDKKLC